MKVKNAFGQEFAVETAKVLSYVRVDKDANGVPLDNAFAAIQLSNGDSINAPLNAIGRGLSASVRWEHLRMLRGAEITYCVGKRVLGEEFTWRPGDTKAAVATGTGVYKSILGIEVSERYWDTIEGLPEYVSSSDEDDEEGEEVPAGAEEVADTTASANKADNASKPKGKGK
jgi:hypothetical protein